MNSKRMAYRFFKDSIAMLTLNTVDDSVYQNFYNGQMNTSVGEFEAVLDNIYSGNIPNAISINNSISTSCNIEYYRKEVNAIYLNTWAQGIREFTSNDSSFLYTVANGDPIEWGDAVYSAQVMLGVYPAPTNPLRIMQSSEEEIEEEVYVFPNPAKDEISIEYSIAENASLEIYNSLGQKTATYNLQAGDVHLIDTSKLQNGIYFYSIVQNDEALLTGKFSILK